MSKARQLPGSVDDATTARGMLMKHFEDAWAEVYEAEGKTDAMKEILKGLDERSTALAKGVPYGNTWSLDKRKKLMFAALVGSYIAMDTEANLEKYATCDSGKMCLHFPLFFSGDNNRAYRLGEEVMSDYKGLVVTKYPSAKRDRLHLMSPCKMDLVVEAHEADGFCKCEEYFDETKFALSFRRSGAGGMWLQREGKLALPLTDTVSEPSAHQEESWYAPRQIEVQAPASCWRDSTPIKPQRVICEFVQRFPPEIRFLIDNSNSVPWSIHYFFHHRPESYHLPTGFASMGWAIGASVGVALGARNTPVVCFTGDGCFLMSGQEITVAVEEQLPVIFVVLNDHAYGMIKHAHRLAGTEPVDFCQMAKVAGAEAYTIRDPKEFEQLDYQDMCSRKGPTLLEVYIDSEEAPPLGMV